ncbi:MAG: TonB-dependent receptor [Candidatus Pedobacter colombiensis]|uniref:TonB-dependent receptor n=1 Tax=Candidatus Pedobacter colombiensis TaxID=3121371 RepID=A0AAJ5WAG0_9SPHI|nr:TonB-dependent receptor [Pedobacter sp.]WEK19242.1 MAG: TonB-dependent receptor [Pedobacter sp.]
MKRIRLMRLCSLLMIFYLCLSTALVSAQENRTIKGVVKSSEDSQPLPGVSVSAVGSSSAGTMTDKDGQFQIVVEKSVNTLLFRSIGMNSKEVSIQNNQTLEVVLTPSTQSLNDVVVVGYGTQKKSLVTGAIASLRAKDLDISGLMRADQALQGRAAGVSVMMNSGQPGSGVSIRIRGIGTNGSNDPLLIVDGYPVNDLEGVNPRDIETMEVLKDAASAAIYGARGANGVVIVTTKKGKAGQYRVNYDYYYGIQNVRKYIDVLDATQYARIQNEAYFNSNLPLPFSSDEIAKMGAGTNWQKEVSYNNAPIQSHQASLSGGSDRSTFNSSFSYFSQDGTLAKGKSNFERYTGRINTEQKFLDGLLTTGVNLNFANVKRAAITSNAGNAGPILSAINMDPVTPVMKDDGTFAISRYVSQEIVNPIARIYYSNGASGYTRLIGDAFGELQILKDLKLRSTIGYTFQYDQGSNYTPIYYLNSTNFTLASGASKSAAETKTLNFENTLTYGKTIQKNTFSILVGNTIRKGQTSNVSASKNGLLYDDPAFAYLDLAKDNTSAAASGGAGHSAFLSYFGRLNYDYDGRFMATASFRADGSYNFGSNNKFGYFPSISAGWNVSKEHFMENETWLNNLKLRASWGQTGNDNIGEYSFVSTISTYARNYYWGANTQMVGASPSKISNPDLKWETSEQTNIGFDADFLNNFNATFDVYSKKTKDLLLTPPIPLYVGNGAPSTNGAAVVNKGIELSLGYKKDFGKLNINLNVNGAYNFNKVTEVGNATGFIVGSDASNQMQGVTRMQVGYPMGYFWLYAMDGIFQNQSEIDKYVGPTGAKIQPNAVPGDIRYKDLNGDGVIDSKDRSNMGSPHPKYNYGFNLTMRYANFDLNVFFNGLAGNKIFNSLHRWDLPTANYPIEILNRWHGEGTSNTYPRVAAGDANGNFTNPSDFFLEDGSYLRLKNVALGYTIKNLSKYKINNIRLYATGTNLFVLTKYTGFDPEVSGTALGIGIDRGVYPQPRTFIFGASIGF